MKKTPPTAGELKARVRDNKRARGLELVSEVWVLPSERPRLMALLAKFDREREAAVRELLT